MDPRFQEIFTSTENSIFKVVFFPDRIYHAQYLNASRSPRYRYNVQEVRGKGDMAVLKGEVYLDGRLLTNFLRVEYRASRLVEVARERRRFLRDRIGAWVRLVPDPPGAEVEAMVKLHHCRWVDAYQVEFWETLEPPPASRHDFQVLDQMGRDAPITRMPQFAAALREVKKIRRVQLAFSENDVDLPYGFAIPIGERQWDNNYLSSHQEPLNFEPSSPDNTINDGNYLIDFQRGWYLDANATRPVRYRNAMMVREDNPDAHDDNVIEMRWLLQREFGGTVVFFHEVTIPPLKVEGTHRHIGSEELYYVVSGEGFAYMGVGDDPATDGFPTVEREVFAIGKGPCKELPVRAGHVIFTKSGGVHGIRNSHPTEPLKFVAFLYQSS